MTQAYLLINTTNNVCENSVVWDGNTETWIPPTGWLILEQAATPSKVWGLSQDGKTYTLVETVGDGRIGSTWDGTYLITDEPQPDSLADQPISQGAQTL